jgi:TonB family protein
MTRRAAVVTLWLAVAGTYAAAQPPPVYMPFRTLQLHILSQRPPVYPELARTARIEGTVRLAAWIGTDGTVWRLELIGGHPFLVEAAIDAVKQWLFRPWIDGDVRLSVVTEIDVPFWFKSRHRAPRRPFILPISAFPFLSRYRAGWDKTARM